MQCQGPGLTIVLGAVVFLSIILVTSLLLKDKLLTKKLKMDQGVSISLEKESYQRHEDILHFIVRLSSYQYEMDMEQGKSMYYQATFAHYMYIHRYF